MKETEAISLHLAANDRRFARVYREDPKGTQDAVDFTYAQALLKQRQVHKHMGGDPKCFKDFGQQIAKTSTRMFTKGPRRIRTKSIIGSLVLGIVIRLISQFIMDRILDRYFD